MATCIICGKEFQKKSEGSRTCSRRCYIKLPEHRKYMKEYLQRPDVKAKRRKDKQRPEYTEQQRKYKQRPAVKKRRLEYQREYQKRPYVKERNRRKAIERYHKNKKLKMESDRPTGATTSLHKEEHIIQTSPAIANCSTCGKEFVKKYANSKRTTCSPTCYGRLPARKEKMREYWRKYSQRPEEIGRRRLYQQRPHIKEKVRQYYQSPEVKKRIKRYVSPATFVTNFRRYISERGPGSKLNKKKSLSEKEILKLKKEYLLTVKMLAGKEKAGKVAERLGIIQDM